MRYLAILLILGCGTDKPPADNDPYPTFQDCFNDHHHVENFNAQDAIEVCCIDHPIGSAAMNVVCGATSADCQTYVDANLTDPDVTADVTTAACDQYVIDRGA